MRGTGRGPREREAKKSAGGPSSASPGSPSSVGSAAGGGGGGGGAGGGGGGEVGAGNRGNAASGGAAGTAPFGAAFFLGAAGFFRGAAAFFAGAGGGSAASLTAGFGLGVVFRAMEPLNLMPPPRGAAGNPGPSGTVWP